MKLSNIELRFVYNVNAIAELYNCRMTYCDPNTRTILIEGAPGWQSKCYAALTEYFKTELEIKELKEIEIFLDNIPKVV